MSPSAKTSLSIAVCLAAVLLLAGLGAAGFQTTSQDATAAQPQAADDLALPERVVLPQDRTSGSAVVGIDAGGALGSSGSQLEGAYERYLLEERLADAETNAERRRILNRSVGDIERQVEQLRERERSARESYRNGEMTESTFLATLRHVNDRAAELEARADMISPSANARTSGLADEYGASRASNRIAQLRGEMLVLQGPVREAVGDRNRDGAAPERFHVTASVNGTVLAFITDGTYYREAVRPGVLSRADVAGLNLDDTSELARNELYPRFVDQYGFSVISTVTNNRIHRLFGERQYEHGLLESYVDAVSQNVFWESQRMELSEDLPRAPAVTNASGSLSVAVRPTYDTGPASVRVTDDGSPVANETVMVDGEAVAETNENGLAWVVLPDDSPTVRVTAGGQSAHVTVNWGTVYQ